MPSLSITRAVGRRSGLPWWLIPAPPAALIAVLAVLGGVALVGVIGAPAASNAAAARQNAANGSCTLAHPPAALLTTTAPSTAAPSTTRSAAADPAHLDGVTLSATQLQNAQTIVGIGKTTRATAADMAIALAVGYVNSKLDAAASSAGGIGAGLFLQTSQLYPGVDRADPAAAAAAFFHRLLLQENADGALSFDEGVMYMAGLGTASAADYTRQAGWATALADLLNTGTPAPGQRFDVDCIGAAGDNTVFAAGNIISDAVFYNARAMTVEQIRAFIDVQNQPCATDNPWCLKNLTLSTPAEPADQYCADYPGGTDQDAATVIAAFSISCGINPQVMLTTLQKESQGLNRADPTAGSYDAAWGWNCPDTGAGGSANCDQAGRGFFRQGYNMAKQWSKYRARIPTGYYPYQVGKTVTILWNIAASGCGGGAVTIANVATASLYVYTPYQPNPASIGGFPGEGDRCSSYGNRNFFFLFRKYFGSTGGGAPTANPGAPGGAVGSPVIVAGVNITLPVRAGITGTVVAPNPAVARAITAGLDWLGEPYSWGGGSPAGPTLGICGPGGAHNDCNVTGFDCSGLMLYMWAQVGIPVSHFSQDIFRAGTQIPWDQKVAGDMIGYSGHIAIYVGAFGGADYMLEAPQSGEFVRVTPVRNSPGEPHYDTVSRVWVGR